MKTIRLFIFIALVLKASACYGEDNVYSDLIDQRYWFRTVIVPEDELEMTKLEQTAHRFLAMTAGRPLVVLSLYTDRRHAGMAVAASRESYRGWQVYYSEAAATPLRTAQVISLNGGWALRVRQADGTVEKRITGTKDPLLFESSGATFEILIVQPHVGTKFDSCEPAPLLSPIVYMKTDAELTAAISEKAAGKLARILRAPKLFARFRNDHWFISFSGFPVRYPYSMDQAPPSEAEYYRSDAFTCNVSCGPTATCIRTLGPSLPPRR